MGNQESTETKTNVLEKLRQKMIGTKSDNIDIDEDEEIKEENITIPAPKINILEKLNKEIQELSKYKAKYEINDNGSVTFWPTPNCEPSQKQLETKKISPRIGYDYETVTYSDPDKTIIESRKHSFIASSLEAWSTHYPFRFRVEHIWLLILQAVAVHVDQNAEKLRKKYVTHSGKKKLTIIDVSQNPSYQEWINIIQQFVNQIDKNTVDDTCKLLDCNFSSTSLTEKIATKVTIMDICKNYFQYGMRTCCGFPKITIDGTKQDWIKLKHKTKRLLNEKVDKKFGEEWGKALLPLLDRFIVAFDGDIDCIFWNSMIKRGAWHGSGGYSWYCGWINIFFPLIRQRWNHYCTPYSIEQEYIERASRGPDINFFPNGLGSAPVKWNQNGKKLEMKFEAGFAGYTQDPNTLEICPNIAWYIGRKLSEKEMKEKRGY